MLVGAAGVGSGGNSGIVVVVVGGVVGAQNESP